MDMDMDMEKSMSAGQTIILQSDTHQTTQKCCLVSENFQFIVYYRPIPWESLTWPGRTPNWSPETLRSWDLW